ncbi:MAG: signal peptidase I [Thaumarchaeota archaeon]|nr:signal peptidase I [Nitrososphaerota archaeon]MCZ6724628.1 signal peptidase I [Nitrososphaerota archaeon]
MNRIIKSFSWFFIILGLLLLVWLGFTFVMGTDRPLYVVSSSSMEPTLRVGDIILVQNVPFDRIKEGDIMVFQKGSLPIIVHRVHEVIEGPVQKLIITKGDNSQTNPSPDYPGLLPSPIKETDYLGRVDGLVPYVGFLTGIFPPPLNIILIVIILALIVLSEIFPNKKSEEVSI